MVNIVIFGPPGSGKGTQSEKIIGKYGFAHISTGDLLRSETASGSELGNKVKSIMEKGELVSDNLIIDVMESALNRLGDVPGVIFDGFPRTVNQAAELKKMLNSRGTEVSAMLSLEVDHDELVNRLLLRKEQTGRSDDNLETIENRIKVYHDQTAPVMDFYKKEGKFHAIDGTGSIDEIFERIDKVLKDL